MITITGFTYWNAGDAMTDDPKGPIEDDLDNPAKQDPSPDLPSPVEGNDDEDDTEEEEDG